MSQDYLARAETELQVYRDSVERWDKAIRDGTKQDLNRQYYDEIQGLESKCAAAEIALNSCKFSPHEDARREGLEKALDELREAAERFRERFFSGRDEE